ncbi:hypothetical protein AJ78_00870 [Emergomyces pasteurianus Ep9510]|uniref:Uncharacterized protein n=1 Tax=Emergomyces pasteurianus Ep9510 TaxID=1447872 RepID=A0A1J9PTD9_9EURO|nr:hypothetical protein AJ78_00870 [Emergomyces pasteurianus Ep9510]
MVCPITVSKFVGTISLGLLTGLSYATSIISIPSLQTLPNASAASRTLKQLQLRTSNHVLTLSHITAIALFTAFTLSSPRRRHPYLIWTALTSLIGGAGLEWWYKYDTMTWSSLSGGLGLCSCHRPGFGVISWSFARANAGSSVSVRSEEEDSNGNGSEIEIVGDEEASSAAAAGSTAPNPAAKQAEDELNINGEAVQSEMQQERKLQNLRMWILGLGFSMGVVGIWGEGA